MIDEENTEGHITGLSIKHEASRYREIDPAVSQMGGWANFRYWIKQHSVLYFRSLDEQVNKNKELEEINAALQQRIEDLEYHIQELGERDE